MDGPPAARFSDRLNAFALDGSIFASGFVLSMLAIIVSRGNPVTAPSFVTAWAAGWGAAFVMYHAYFGSEGRQTLGKRLFGLAVVDADGEAPGFGAAVTRTLGYFVSSLFLNAGFLWALRQERRAWHDKIAGTRVIEAEERSPRFRLVSAACAWLLAAAMAGTWFAAVVVAPSMARMKLLAEARIGLNSLAVLQNEHKAANGAYATELSVLLAGRTPEAIEVKRALHFHLDQESVKITAGDDWYEIEADAWDDKRTRLTLRWPSEGRGGP